MTLIIAVRNKNNLLIGADSRGILESQSGRLMSDIHEKMVQLNKHCCILIAGDPEKGIYLIEQFKQMINKSDDIVTINKKFSKFCQEEFSQLLQFMRIDSDHYPRLVFILAGIQKKQGYKNKKKLKNVVKPRIFILRSTDVFCPGERREYAIEGVDLIADYLFAKEFEIDMESDKAIELITRCLYETEKITGDVGGEFLVAQIDNKYGFKRVDVNDIIQDFENEKLKKIADE